jgi:hypothetical protein
MMELVSSPEEFPKGSHSVGFYGSRPEAAHNIASFLKGAVVYDQDAIVFTADDEMMSLYRDAVEKEVPQMLSAFHRLPGPHIRPTADGFRPVETVDQFVGAHPSGASMCGDTIPDLLNRRTLPNVLTYEDWFDGLRPFYHRGLCPYDLNNFPVDQASDAFTRLARTHTHGVLSSDPQPAVQFLQLLILPAVENPPENHLGWLARAVDRGLVNDDEHDGEAAALTPRGQAFARALRALPSFVRAAGQTSRASRSDVQRGQEDPRSPRLTLEE